ncbi:MAG TPA: hypothetical protein VNF05_01170 [Acidimicrobiales bacterium]|nr:hypothetical protein [Acidimicrobiales bacterium]
MTRTPETPAQWWRPLRRSDRWALAWFVIVPTVLFVVPALLGRPAIDADNLIQNFPLRVLAGHQIASGHLPLLDPLTNAGTPLLGGMNAGALYPLTVIFAFVPAIAAWIFNLIVVYVTAGVGAFVLLRWHGLRTTPSFVAAMSYAYSGAMIGQVVHLGVVQGFSFIPWATVLMLALSRRLQRVASDASWLDYARVSLPWVCAVALLWGLTFLTGEPRGIADMELLTIFVVPSVLLLRTSYWITTWRARGAYLLTLLVGFAWGVGLGLVQVLPGWSFINFSQRAGVNYWFFGAGSLPVRWSALLFVPDIFGGSGVLGQPGFFVNYNLAEVTGYAGVVALMAAAAFLTRLSRRGWRGTERDYTVYVVVGVVGLFAAWGSFTPVGHVLRDIPVFGSTRLQSRNIILFDFALAMVLGWWLQHVQDAKLDRAGLGKRSRWLTMTPAALVAALSVAMLGWGPAVIARVGVPQGVSTLASGLKLTDSVHLIVALAAVAAVLIWRHSPRLFRFLVVVLVVDLVVFSVFTSTGLIGGTTARESPRSIAVALLGTKGRFALVGNGAARTGVFRVLGEPNMNVSTGLASVQGYGALISTLYDNATGTHPQATLNACHLADGTFTQLRLDAIAISASELATNSTLAKVVPPTCVPERTTPSTRRYFGQVLRVDYITMASTHGHPLSNGALTVQLLNGNGRPFGRVFHLRSPQGNGAKLQRAGFGFAATRAAGFVVRSIGGVNVGDVVVTTHGGASYRLDTSFQLALSSTAWRLTSTEDGFSVFKAASLRPPVWLTSPANGHVSKIRSASWGDTWVNVTVKKSSVLERSEAYLPGWRATALNVTTGRSLELSVYRVGLIEGVRVPKGTWTIHFHYHAPYIEVSVAASAVSFVLLVGVATALDVRRRRRPDTKVLS